ncbi:FliM/FliN family flagellar motor switch protein [Massilia sp. CMS3.1]|uniref:FliM/FliN family flagellar motor switch protein n=1 Tax=Massilia sp. CMS3.1 TaxID=3373083 RepID=UPI003EE59242
MHLLPSFAGAFAEDMTAMLSAPGWRRYWSSFELAAVVFERAPDSSSLRWLGVSGPHGSTAVAFERALLVGLLEARYSGKGSARELRDPAGERVTATEERLAHTLTQQLSEVLAMRVRVAAGAAGVDVASSPLSQVVPATPGKNAWALAILLREPQGGSTARCYIAPDARMMGLILQALQPERPQRARPAESIGASLKVKLDGRLVTHEITLEALFGLKVGDVIPVSVGRADVLLDEARLFTAAVAEHKGKLCLTSFEDAE